MLIIFFLGALIGVILGCMLCIYLRREITADIAPILKRIQLQLDNIEAQQNLAMTTRYSELITRIAHREES
jgi:hypothetical protein